MWIKTREKRRKNTSHKRSQIQEAVATYGGELSLCIRLGALNLFAFSIWRMQTM